MTSQRVRAVTGQRAAIPRARHGKRLEGLPDLRPAAGHYLLAGIDAVLPRLAPASEPLPLVDDLRVALARTAACGDTCRVRGAADGVRLAANLLLAGSIEDARLVLLRARSELDGRARLHD